jgi:predicted transcriptional regulator
MVAISGAKKTQIMYGANLSFKILNRYLEDVISSSLLKLEDQQQYFVTQKGQDFLRAYERYSKINKKADTHLASVRASKKALEDFCPCK